jgi:hypothetical protein
MNSQDWKNIVGAVAPTIATILGGPVAGTAVGALSTALLGRPDGSEAEIAAAVSTATPEVLAKIKQADAELKTALANAGVRIEEIAAQDRANARAREIQTKDPTTRRLAILYTLIYFAVLWAVWQFEVPDSMHDTLNVLIGVLTAAQAAIMNYYFGSSSGSDSKTQILDRVVNHR